MVKNLPANAGDLGLNPGLGFDSWSRKIPHGAEQLSTSAITIKACEPRVAPTIREIRSPHTEE